MDLIYITDNLEQLFPCIFADTLKNLTMATRGPQTLMKSCSRKK